MVCVRDYGVGIPEAELPFVKEKFYKGSSKERGSGIGLAVTDEIVKLHGGTLTIRSKAGEGTAVYVSYKGSSKERGSGIGLAVTDEIVKLHGGTLTIRSKAGEGTAVYVSVPAIDVHTALGVETSIAEENTQ